MTRSPRANTPAEASEPSAPRRRGVAIVSLSLSLLLLCCLALAWFARTTSRQLAQTRARLDVALASPLPRDDPGWASGADFAFHLDPPGSAMKEWRDAMQAAREERLPAPPAALVAWLEAHAAEVDDLAARVSATGPLDLPPFASPVINRADLDHPFVAAIFARRLLVAAAGIAAFDGSDEVAERRLAAAWTLHVSLDRIAGTGPGEDLLGALRVVRTEDPRAWLERLRDSDARSRSIRHRALEARHPIREMNQFKDFYEQALPTWLPHPARRVATQARLIPIEWTTNRNVGALLDAREALLAQESCADPAVLIEPGWDAGLRSIDWLPTSRRARTNEALARASEEMADLNLTREVLRIRAGLAEEREACGGPRLHVEPTADGQLRVVAESLAGEGVAPFVVAPSLSAWSEGSRAQDIVAPR